MKDYKTQMSVKLEVKDVCKAYFLSDSILERVNFLAVDGERCFIFGKNGSGKTTFLKLISMLLTPDSGAVNLHVNGKKVLSRNKNGYFEFLFAGTGGFFHHLSGLNNLVLFAALYGIDEQAVLDRLSPYRRLPLVTRILNTNYSKCSTGMKKMLGLMRIAVVRAPIILLDEPFKHLDVDMSRQFISSFYELKNTLQIATGHRVDENPFINSRIYELRNGQLHNYI